MSAPTSEASRLRLRIGPVRVDVVTFAQALDAIAALVMKGSGGMVFTPNVDHVVNAEATAALRAAYAEVDLSLADGMPVVWASRLLGCALPERIAGSDLAWPVLQRAAKEGWRVFFLGGNPGVAQQAADIVERDLGLKVLGVESPRIDADGGGPQAAEAVARIQAVKPHLLFVGFGSPKQEVFIHRHRAALPSTVSLAVGATFDFIAGVVPRAPGWMSRMGLEWSYRLLREPRRLWRRYLVNDPKFLAILARELRAPAHERVQRVSQRG
jgi:N-acetylglucosaminyldiphosphoundecaprenol N-acetyl-beta-D-mannosaminyltransferase